MEISELYAQMHSMLDQMQVFYYKPVLVPLTPEKPVVEL